MKSVTKKYFSIANIMIVLLLMAMVPLTVNLSKKNQENRSSAAVKNDNKCTNAGGKCIKTSSNTAKGTYCNQNTGKVGNNSSPTGFIVFGLCSGDSTIRCCQPFSDTKCKNAGGRCISNVSSSKKEGDQCQYSASTNGKYVFGKCDGGSDRRCCVPGSGNVTDSSKSTPTPTPTKAAGSNSSSSSRIVVGTFNIGHANKTSKASASSIASKIKSSNIDIVGLQEVNSSSSLTKSISSNAGFGNYFHTASSAGNSVVGNLSLSSKTYHNITKSGDTDSKRVLQKVVLRVNGKNVSFYNAHIDYKAIVRDSEAKAIVSIIKADSNPYILVGDFNFAGSGCGTANSIFSGHDIVYDSSSGTRCTDMIIVSKNRGIKVVSSKTHGTKGSLSDHNLVTATIEVN